MTLVQKIQKILSLPEMRIFWFVLPAILATAVLQGIFLDGIPLAICMMLLGVVIVLVFFFGYQSAVISYNAAIERNELKGVVGSLEDALIVYDQNFTILFFNPAAERLFGIKKDEIVGHSITPRDAANTRTTLLTQVIYPSLAPSMINRSATTSYPQIVDVSLADPLLELRIVTSKVFDDRGVVLGFMKLVRDRTREISIIKSKNEFITTASHQLRTPLTEISWAAEALASEGQGMTENAKTIIENLRNSSKELISITEDLLNIAKIEEGHFGYNFKQTDIVEFVTSVLNDIHPLIQKAGLKLYFEKPSQPIASVLIDAQKLTLALNNLLENAIRYNVKNGEVMVKIEPLTDVPFVKVTVKDTGIGIPQEDIQKLFGKFFRAQNAVRFETKGSGLGLYIVKNIVRSHGGDIAVISEINRGTAISITIPTDPTLVPQHEAVLEM